MHIRTETWQVSRRALLVLPLLLGIACSHGSRTGKFPPSWSASGVMVTMQVHGERTRRTAELMSVDSLGVVVCASTVVRIHWGRLQKLDAKGLGADYDMAAGEHPSSAKRGRLALVSRFPQGMSPSVIAALLSKLSQAAIEEVR